MNPVDLREWLSAQEGGFGLAGVSSDGEVFLSCTDPEYFQTPAARKQEAALIKGLRAEFPGAGRVTFVVKPSMTMLREMVDGLNSFLGEQDRATRPNLLGIGGFDGRESKGRDRKADG